MVFDLSLLNVTPKVNNILRRNGISHIEELQTKSREEILGLRGIGPKYCTDIENAVKQFQKGGSSEEDVSDDSGPGSLRIEGERPTVKPVRVFSWCPDKDLIALIFESNLLELRRLGNWELLFNEPLKTTHRILNLCWSPDSSTLVFGDENGECFFFDINTKQTTSIFLPSLGKELPWIECSGSCTEVCQSKTYLLPNLLCPPKISNMMRFNRAKQKPEQLTQAKRNSYPDRLSILIAPSENGVLNYMAFGGYKILDTKLVYFPENTPPIKILDPNEELKSTDIVLDITRIGLSGDFSMTSMVLKHKATGGQWMVQMMHPIIKERSDEIKFFASNALELEFLMDHLQESFEYIVAKWEKFIKPWKHKLPDLDYIIKESGKKLNNETRRAEFIRAFSIGNEKEDPFDIWAKKWLVLPRIVAARTSADSEIAKLCGTIESLLIRCLDEMILRLKEIQGLARWKARCSFLGLKEATIEGIIGRLEELRMKFCELKILLTRTCRRYKVMLNWIAKLLSSPEKVKEPTEFNLHYTGKLYKDIVAFVEDEVCDNRVSEFLTGEGGIVKGSKYYTEIYGEQKENDCSVQDYIHDAKESLLEIKNVTSNHIRNVTEMDFSFMSLTNTILPSYLSCFKQGFSHKNNDANELYPQFACHAYNTEDSFTILTCQFVCTDLNDVKEIAKPIIDNYDPWSDEGEYFIPFTQKRKDRIVLKYNLVTITQLPFPHAVKNIGFYDSSKILVLLENTDIGTGVGQGAVIEYKFPIGSETNAREFENESFEDIVKILKETDTETCIPLTELRWKTLNVVPKDFTFSSIKSIVAILGDRDNHITVLDMQMDEGEESSDEDESMQSENDV